MIEQDLTLAFQGQFGAPSAWPASQVSAYFGPFLKTLCAISGTTQSQRAYWQNLERNLPPSKVTAVTHTRETLYNYLTEHPLFTTLLQLNWAEKTDELNMQLYLLAHTYLARSHDDYDAYLCFYQSFLKPDRNAPSHALSVHFLQNCTRDELTLKLHRLHIDTFARFLKPAQARSRSTKSILEVENISVQSLSEDDYVRTDDVTLHNAEGQTKCHLLRQTPLTSASDAQAKRAFRHARTGKQRALYQLHVNQPWKSAVATAGEVRAFLFNVNRGLVDGEFEKLSPSQTSYLLIFFLELLGVAKPWMLKLRNERARHQSNNSDKSGTLSYQFEPSSGLTHAHLELGAHLLNVKKPETHDKRLHFYAQPRWPVSLPYPVPALLRQALQKVDAQKRHERPLGDALAFTGDAYRRFLSTTLHSPELASTDLTPAKLKHAFTHYAAEIVPGVAFHYMQGEASVQHHYLSLERTLLESTLLRSWHSFIAEVMRKTTSGPEALMPPTFSQSYHDEIGSKLTLRESVLRTLCEHLTTLATDCTRSLLTRYNHLALCLYFLIAAESGLRPVQKPFPGAHYVDFERGFFTTRDKRSHHQSERRLVVLTPELSGYLKRLYEKSLLLAATMGCEEPEAVLMHFDTEKREFVHFSSSVVNARLAQLTGESLHCRSLRHVAASRFTMHQLQNKSFKQNWLNFLLNHHRAGASMLHPNGLTSATSLSEILQSQQGATTITPRVEKAFEKAMETLK